MPLFPRKRGPRYDAPLNCFVAFAPMTEYFPAGGTRARRRCLRLHSLLRQLNRFRAALVRDHRRSQQKLPCALGVGRGTAELVEVALARCRIARLEPLGYRPIWYKQWCADTTFAYLERRGDPLIIEFLEMPPDGPGTSSAP